jgi:hypothetical protein
MAQREYDEIAMDRTSARKDMCSQDVFILSIASGLCQGHGQTRSRHGPVLRGPNVRVADDPGTIRKHGQRFSVSDSPTCRGLSRPS